MTDELILPGPQISIGTYYKHTLNGKTYKVVTISRWLDVNEPLKVGDELVTIIDTKYSNNVLTMKKNDFCGVDYQVNYNNDRKPVARFTLIPIWNQCTDPFSN